jgi:hypothetical protein
MPKGLNKGNASRLSRQVQMYLNDLDGRETVSARKVSKLRSDVDIIIQYLKLQPNILAFGVGVDPEWIIANGDVPLVSVGTDGLNPPTVVGDTIVINSPGTYEINASFGIDIGSGGNTVTVEININGTPVGMQAGVEFSGGQAAPINQPQARDVSVLAAGDIITFVALELGTDTKLLLWGISGGTVTQMQHDFDALNPPASFGVFLIPRFLEVEKENLAKAIKGEKWQPPGPPPTDLFTFDIALMVSYLGRFPVQVTDPYVIAIINELEVVGIIGVGRAAVILAP